MKNKKALVTGSSGFLGSHIADALNDSGYEVVLFDKHPSPYKQKVYTEILGDILNINDVNKAIERCQFVYHFAAQADIDSSNSDPLQTIQTNIIGTQNILEAARQQNVDRILFARTIYVYSELGSFYRVSKQACEKLIEEYQKEFGLNYTVLRYGSIYGPRANEFNTISNMLIQAIQKNKIVRRGDGKEIREYIHVRDAAQLSVQALDNEFENMHLIISGSQQIKIKDLLLMISEIFKGAVDIEYTDEEDLHHYEITPYAYKPQVARKIAPIIHHDLGQGLLDLVFELEEQLEKEKAPVKVSLRKRKK
jgi:UDP-glucose 4-epimerase